MQVRKEMTIPVSFEVDTDYCDPEERSSIEENIARMTDPEWGMFILRMIAEMFAEANHRPNGSTNWAAIGFGDSPAVMENTSG